MSSTIKLRQGQLAKYRKLSGLDTQQKLADAMGMERSTLSRTLNGFMDPGEKFIAGLLTAFPMLSFEDLFEVVVDQGAGAVESGRSAHETQER
ncbi:transcriptional regulator with XRE-family HTH domain [Rhodococcus sp. PvR044]|uniref:helix-turn-helix domain-containing protein n=1 Tax=Rhodococcus sp. PvR044 TaxID=3156402 RepID=UPI0033929126